MAYKLYSREVFKAEVDGKKYVFTCYTQNTSYGFRHICCDGLSDTTVCAYVKDDIIGKCCYYNRTWENFRYQTVLREGIRKLEVEKAIKDKLVEILVEQKAVEVHEKCEKETKEFENLWSSLSEKNKNHIRNGVGENGIQSEEQAKSVVGVMKMMSAFELLGL